MLKPPKSAEGIKQHFESIAHAYDRYKSRSSAYYKELKGIFAANVAAGSRVLEIGCGTGDLLAHVRPSFGVGIDVSKNMIKAAREKHGQLRFIVSDGENLPLKGGFDHIIMADVVEHLQDSYQTFRELNRICGPRTQLMISSANSRLAIFLHILERLRLKMPEGPHNWPSWRSLDSLLSMCGFKAIRRGSFFMHIAGYMITMRTDGICRKMSVSFIVLAADDRIVSNIEMAIGRRSYEIIVPAGSGQKMRSRNMRRVKADKDASQIGMLCATAGKDLIFICGEDVETEDIRRMLEALEGGKAELVKTTRLLNPIEYDTRTETVMLLNSAVRDAYRAIAGQDITDFGPGSIAFRRKRAAIMEGVGFTDTGNMLLAAAKERLSIAELPIYRNPAQMKDELRRMDFIRTGKIILKGIRQVGLRR